MADGFRLVTQALAGGRSDVVSMTRDRTGGGDPGRDWPEDRLGDGSGDRRGPPAVPVFRYHRDALPAARSPAEGDVARIGYAGALLPPRVDPARVWASLGAFAPDPAHLRRNRMIGGGRDDPATAPVDVLRTRLAQTLADRGWSRVAVTAPGRGCGATFLAANLALSLARRPEGRTVLVDLDLRAPGLAAVLGAEAPGDIAEFLRGHQPMEAHLRRIGGNLAVALNAAPVGGAAELLHDPATAETLDEMVEALSPDVVIYDLPPALGGDEVLGFLPQVDGVLLVADASRTPAREIADCERLFEGRAALLGVVLNRVPRWRARG